MNLIHALFSICCHQYIDRSPQYSGEIFPACYRCTGLYLGIISSYIFLLFKKRKTFSLNKETALLLSMFIVPLYIDGFANHFYLWNTPGPLRSITGMLCGISLPLFLISIRNNNIDLHHFKKINFFCFIIPAIIGSLFILSLVLMSSSFVFYALVILTTSGMLLFFSNMLLALIKLIAKK